MLGAKQIQSPRGRSELGERKGVLRLGQQEMGLWRGDLGKGPALSTSSHTQWNPRPGGRAGTMKAPPFPSSSKTSRLHPYSVGSWVCGVQGSGGTSPGWVGWVNAFAPRSRGGVGVLAPPSGTSSFSAPQKLPGQSDPSSSKSRRWSWPCSRHHGLPGPSPVLPAPG